MGRAGSGRSSSRSHSRSGHSIGRSSGGHRIGGGHSRAGSSSSRSFSSSSFSGSSYRSFGSGYRNYGGYGGYGGFGGGRSVSSVIIIAIVVIVCAVVLISKLNSISAPRSTINREPLTGVAFNNNCIVDEIDWFDNISRVSKELQYFHKKTGIAPYIVLHQYDPSLTTATEKEEWAEAYYDANIDNEGTFLFVYFAEQNVDEDVGYMCYVNGTSVTSVMDAEAIDIFWSYIDKYWYSDMSTDEMFATTFNKTADTIMKVSTTTNDVLKWVVIILGIVIVLIILFVWWKAKAQRRKEEAEETERILNAPIEDLSDNGDLTDKYD